MRREANECLNGQRGAIRVVLNIRCNRADHEVHIYNGGAIVFPNHNCWSAKDLSTEQALHDPKTLNSNRLPKGCYAVAHIITHLDTYNAYDFRKHGSRRGKGLKLLGDAGVKDYFTAGILINEMLVKHSKRAIGAPIDEYCLPFWKVPAQRIGRIYAKIRAEQDKKLDRVMKSLAKQGFTPFDKWVYLRECYRQFHHDNTLRT